MVTHVTRHMSAETALSVLALSSRFDGREPVAAGESVRTLSVLALSSRFDGPAPMY